MERPARPAPRGVEGLRLVRVGPAHQEIFDLLHRVQAVVSRLVEEIVTQIDRRLSGYVDERDAGP